MRNLSIKDQSKKLLKIKEIRKMKIEEVEKYINDFKNLIYIGEIDDYIVNTFVILCDKAIDYFFANQNNKYMDYAKLKRDLLEIKKVKNLLNQPAYTIKLFNKLPSLFKYCSK